MQERIIAPAMSGMRSSANAPAPACWRRHSPSHSLITLPLNALAVIKMSPLFLTTWVYRGMIIRCCCSHVHICIIIEPCTHTKHIHKCILYYKAQIDSTYIYTHTYNTCINLFVRHMHLYIDSHSWGCCGRVGNTVPPIIYIAYIWAACIWILHYQLSSSSPQLRSDVRFM